MDIFTKFIKHIDSYIAPQHPKNAITKTKAPRAITQAAIYPGCSELSNTCLASPIFFNAIPPITINAIPPIYKTTKKTCLKHIKNNKLL